MSRLPAVVRALPRGTPGSILVWLVVLALAIAMLLPFRGDRHEGAIALALLLPPLLATGAGVPVAAAAAVVSGLAFNFFFTRPYDSPRIHASSSLAAFVVYILVSVIVASAVARARESRELADRRARDATLLQSVTVELIRNTRLAPTLRSGLAEVVDALGLVGACLHAGLEGQPIAAAAGEAGRCEERARRVLGTGAPSPATVPLRPDGQPGAFPLVSPTGPLGVLVADPGTGALGPDRERVLEAVAGVMALALERARLAAEGARVAALEETDRLRTTLVQSVSHDLRTPLTAIKAAASALQTGHPPEEARAAMLRDIEAESDRLAHLVTSLLDLSRIEAGALRLQRDRAPVDDLVFAALAAARIGAAEQDVEVDVPEGLPLLNVDETLIRQVLANLIQNAAGHGDGPIRVDARAMDGTVRLRVIDHGPGIPEAERRRLFEPYTRLRPGTRGDGAGLALAISRGFVEAHGGTIGVEPTPGGGATFTVALPA